MTDGCFTFEAETYYWVDYEALNVLCLDALNELNVKADNIKTRLAMPVETYPAIYSGAMPQIPSDQYEVTGINVTPVNGAEGTQVTWTLLGTDLPKELSVMFKLTGTFNYTDIALVEEESNKSRLVIANPQEGWAHSPQDVETLGTTFGKFTVGDSGSANIKMLYVKDAAVEGDETITMTLIPCNDNFGKALPAISTTATITDS